MFFNHTTKVHNIFIMCKYLHKFFVMYLNFFSHSCYPNHHSPHPAMKLFSTHHPDLHRLGWCCFFGRFLGVFPNFPKRFYLFGKSERGNSKLQRTDTHALVARGLSFLEKIGFLEGFSDNSPFTLKVEKFFANASQPPHHQKRVAADTNHPARVARGCKNNFGMT